MVAYHDDMSAVKGADAFVQGWTQLIQYMPALKMEIKEAIQEGISVWVYSRISGLPGGIEKDYVDMGAWDD
jgi:predicted SnoaL-like aldol condensation-catalyzing enzyme